MSSLNKCLFKSFAFVFKEKQGFLCVCVRSTDYNAAWQNAQRTAWEKYFKLIGQLRPFCLGRHPTFWKGRKQAKQSPKPWIKTKPNQSKTPQPPGGSVHVLRECSQAPLCPASCEGTGHRVTAGKGSSGCTSFFPSLRKQHEWVRKTTGQDV